MNNNLSSSNSLPPLPNTGDGQSTQQTQNEQIHNDTNGLPPLNNEIQNNHGNPPNPTNTSIDNNTQSASVISPKEGTGVVNEITGPALIQSAPTIYSKPNQRPTVPVPTTNVVVKQNEFGIGSSITSFLSMMTIIGIVILILYIAILLIPDLRNPLCEQFGTQETIQGIFSCI